MERRVHVQRAFHQPGWSEFSASKLQGSKSCDQQEEEVVFNYGKLTQCLYSKQVSLTGSLVFSPFIPEFFSSDGESNNVFELEDLLGLLPSDYTLSLFWRIIVTLSNHDRCSIDNCVFMLDVCPMQWPCQRGHCQPMDFWIHAFTLPTLSHLYRWASFLSLSF